MKNKFYLFIAIIPIIMISLMGCDKIIEGGEYGSYIVDDVTIKGGIVGTYTFYAENGNDGYVELYHNGQYVEKINYNWQTTVTSTQTYTFNFSIAKITVKKAGTGSINLYNMPQSIFDGYHCTTVLRILPVSRKGGI